MRAAPLVAAGCVPPAASRRVERPGRRPAAGCRVPPWCRRRRPEPVPPGAGAGAAAVPPVAGGAARAAARPAPPVSAPPAAHPRRRAVPSPPTPVSRRVRPRPPGPHHRDGVPAAGESRTAVPTPGATLTAGAALGLVGEDAVVTGAAAVRGSPDEEEQHRARRSAGRRRRCRAPGAARAAPGGRARTACRAAPRRAEPCDAGPAGSGRDPGCGIGVRSEVAGQGRAPQGAVTVERSADPPTQRRRPHAETRRPTHSPACRSSGRSRASDAASPGCRSTSSSSGQRQPGRPVALAVQPQVGDVDRPRRARPARSCRTSRRGRRPTRRRGRRRPGAARAPRCTSRSAPSVGRLALVQRAARRPPGAAVVRPPGAVLQQHLGALLAVAVQQQAGRARPAPVAVALGAGRPAVGRGDAPAQ